MIRGCRNGLALHFESIAVRVFPRSFSAHNRNGCASEDDRRTGTSGDCLKSPRDCDGPRCEQRAKRGGNCIGGEDTMTMSDKAMRSISARPSGLRRQKAGCCVAPSTLRHPIFRTSAGASDGQMRGARRSHIGRRDMPTTSDKADGRQPPGPKGVVSPGIFFVTRPRRIVSCDTSSSSCLESAAPKRLRTQEDRMLQGTMRILSSNTPSSSLLASDLWRTQRSSRGDLRQSLGARCRQLQRNELSKQRDKEMGRPCRNPEGRRDIG